MTHSFGRFCPTLFIKIVLIVFFSLSMNGCGGGGGSSETTSKTQTSKSQDDKKNDNQAPQVEILGFSETSEQSTFELYARASDSDGQISHFQWQYTSNAELVLSDTTSETIRVELPDIDTDTTADFTVTVTDNLGKTSSAHHSVTILKVTVPLTVAISGESLADANSPMTLSVQTNIAPENIKSIYWRHDSSLPFSLLNQDTKLVTVSAPKLSEQVTVNFTVTVDHIDGTSSSATHAVIFEPASNMLPVVSITGPTEITEGAILSLQGQAIDPDGDSVSVMWTHNYEQPLALQNPEQPALSVTAPNVMVNTPVEFTLTATDAEGETQTATHSVTIVALPNALPTAEIDGPSEIQEQETALFKAQAEDSDGTITQYTWSYSSDLALNVSGENTSQLSVTTPDSTKDQDVVLSLTVTDNQGATYTTSHTLTVTALPNIAPAVQIEAPSEAQERTGITLTGKASDQDGEVVSYKWQHDETENLMEVGMDSATLSVQLPELSNKRDITFTLTVTDNQGDQSVLSHVVSVHPNTIGLTLKGKVTDEPIPFAQVVSHIGDQVFETQANEQGDYELTISVDETAAEQLVRLEATGAGTQAHVALVSQMSSVEQLQSAAGDDATVTSADMFDVNITNVTTAEYALLQYTENQYSTADALSDARKHVDMSEKLKLASVLKATIDHGIALPEGIASTRVLSENRQQWEALQAKLEAQQPELLNQIEQDIKNDNNLVNAHRFEPFGHHYLKEAGFTDGFGFEMIFGTDNTGTMLYKGIIPFEWQQEGQNIIVKLDGEIEIYGKRLYGQPDFYSSEFTLSAFESGENATAVTVDFVVSSQNLYNSADKTSFTAELIQVDQLPTPELPALLGNWSLSYYGSNGKEAYFHVELKDNSEAVMYKHNMALVSQWSLTGNTLLISNNLYDLEFTIIRESKLGYTLMAASYAKGIKTQVPATLIRHQNIDFNDFDYQRTWKEIKSKLPKTQFQIDENDAFHFRWHRDIAGQKVAGKLEYYDMYMLNGKGTQYCDTTHPECTSYVTYGFELLSVINDTIVVKYSKNSAWDKFEKVKIYKLSDQTWQFAQFNNSFISSYGIDDKYPPRTALYALQDGRVSTISNRLRCPGPVSPVFLCGSVLVINGADHYANIVDGVIELQNIATEETSYLSIISEDESGIELCHISTAAACSEDNIIRYTYQRPPLTITTQFKGDGRLILPAHQIRYKESFVVEVERLNDSNLLSISGCNGKLIDDVAPLQYHVQTPTESCEISAHFSSRRAHKENTLLVATQLDLLVRDDMPAAWYYEVNEDNTGTFYGLGEQREFTIEQTDGDTFTFNFTNDGQLPVQTTSTTQHTIDGFTISYGPDGTHLGWLFSDPYTNFRRVQTVQRTIDLPDLNISRESLIGSWALAYASDSPGYTQNTVELTLNENHTGAMYTGKDSEDQRTIDLTWDLTTQGIVHLYSSELAASASFKLYEKKEGGFAFAAYDVQSDTDVHYHTHWFRHGAGLLVSKQVTPVTSEQVTGKWRYLMAYEDQGFELYSDGAYRTGQYNGSATAAIDESTLVASAWYNRNFHSYDPYCDPGEAKCQSKQVGEFKIFSVFENYLYAQIKNESGQFVFRPVRFDPTPRLESFAEYLEDNAAFYELDTPSPKKWQFVKKADNGKHFRITSEQGTEYYTNSINGGRLSLFNFARNEQTNYRIIESDQDSITVCPKFGATCTTDELRVLSYKPPRIHVTLDIPEDIEFDLNTSDGYMQFGQPFELLLSHDRYADTYFSSFEGCGVVRAQSRSHFVEFKNEFVTETCTFKVTLSEKPESNAERLGITAPYMKICIDHYRDYYIEHSSTLQCSSGQSDVTDLEGLEKFRYLEQLNLKANFSQAALDTVSNLTLLKELTLVGNDSPGIDPGQQLDLSQMGKLRSISIDRLSLSSLALEEGNWLSSLSLTNSQLDELDLSGSPFLKSLNLEGTHLTSINLQRNKFLERLRANNSQLAEITGVTEKHKLAHLDLQSAQIEYLDLTNFVNLYYLNLDENPILDLDISPAKALQTVNLRKTPLRSLLATEGSTVTSLDLTSSKLTQLNTSQMKQLTHLTVEGSDLSELDLTNNIKLRSLEGSAGKLTHVSFPATTETFWLNYDLSGNQLSSVTIPADLVISKLNLSDNPLKEFTSQGGAESLKLNNTLVEILDLSTMSDLYSLDVTQTPLSELKIPASLSTLRATSTAITQLHIPANSKFRYFSFRNNTLSSMTGLENILTDRPNDTATFYLKDTEVDSTLLQALEAHEKIRIDISAYN